MLNLLTLGLSKPLAAGASKASLGAKIADRLKNVSVSATAVKAASTVSDTAIRGAKALGPIAKWGKENPGKAWHLARLGVTGAAGIYGYASADDGSSGYQKLERAVGFGAMGWMVTNPRFGEVTTRYKATLAEAEALKGVPGADKLMQEKLTSAGQFLREDAKAAFKVSPFKATMTAGALYGAVKEDSNFVGGAAVGAIGYGAYKTLPINRIKDTVRGAWGMKEVSALERVGYMFKGHTPDIMSLNSQPFKRLPITRMSTVGGAVMGMGTTYAAGGDAESVAAAGVGGAVTGGLLGLTGRAAIRFPKTTFGTIGSAGIIAGGAAQAYSTVQSAAPYNLEADGALALGLHTLRHGY